MMLSLTSQSECKSEQPRQQRRAFFLLGDWRRTFLEVRRHAVLPAESSQVPARSCRCTLLAETQASHRRKLASS
jgi:hypothetical protein